MKHFLIVFILFCLGGHTVLAQQHIYEIFMSKRTLANQSYREKNYLDAADYYLQLYNREKLKPKDLAKLADCLFKTNKQEKALEVYRQMEKENIAFAQKSKNQFFVCLLHSGMFSEAWKWYQQKDTSVVNSVYLSSLAENIEPMKINSELDDYGPVAFEKGLLFLSTRPTYSFIATKNKQGENYPQPYLASLAEDGSLPAHELFSFPFLPKSSYAGFTLFAGAEKMIISVSPFSAKNDKARYSLYYCEKNKRKQWDLKYQLDLGEGNFLQPHYHAKEGKLYFTSDIGQDYGTDIFYCRFKPGDTKASPLRLGQNINTPGHEMYPYIHQDSLLIFSSNGHFGMGGFDLYQVNLKREKLEVKNFGAPLNSPYDDYGLIFYPLSRFGFFSSNRNRQGDDIFKFYLK